MFKEQAMETLVLIVALSISMVMPLQSSRITPEECSTEVLEQARRAFRANDLSQAERLAESIVDCPEALGAEAARLLTTVTSRRENDRLWQRAQVLIQRHRFEEACQLLHDIQVTAPDFPNLLVARQRAGCNPDLVQLQEDLDRVDELIEKENWQEARQLLNSLLEKHPDETEAQERRRAVELEIQRIHSKTAALHYDAALRLFEQGDAAGAKSRLQEVLKTSRDYPEARALLRKVETRLQEQANAQTGRRLSIQARELLDGGDFAGAREKIKEAIALQGSDPRLMELRRTIKVALISHEARELLAAGESVEARLKVEEALSLQSSGPLLIELQDYLERQRQETQLRLAVQSFYSGEYAESIAQLKGYLEEKPRPPFAPFAYFYLGASLASVTLMSENAPDHALATAAEHFRTSRHIDPGFIPPLETVSPRIRALFSQALIENR